MQYYEKDKRNIYIIRDHEDKNFYKKIGSTVAIVYVVDRTHKSVGDTLVLHGHGSPNSIYKRAKEIQGALFGVGEEVCVLESSFEVDDLNTIMQNTGYFARYLRMRGLL